MKRIMVTIEDEVFEKLEEYRQEVDETLSQAVNGLLSEALFVGGDR